ncbi:MAG: DUF4340 domain-containing protein [Deltaproteobacteria bacterium]|nr:MAG: DUF4340 domain-containing protein [Deltaproteobacteria bacterium]
MRQVIIYGLLLALALGGAWYQYTAEPGADADDAVVLVQGKPDDIERVYWEGEDSRVTLTRKHDDHGDYLWVEYVKVQERPVAGPTPLDPDAEGEDAAAPTEKVEKKTIFKASDKGDELLGKLAPMHAIRKLDQVDAEKLQVIGLDDPKEKLVITRDGKDVVIEIGGEAYGTKDRYVRLVDTGDIYLVDDQLLKSLQYARTRLVDRSLWSIDRPDIASIEISADGRSVRVDQKNPDDPQAATWVYADTQEPAEQITTWLDKALKLKGTSYVDPEAEDAPKDLVVRFSMTLIPADGKPETVEVLQEGDDGAWFARSEHTRGTLKVIKATARALAEDVGALVDR